MGRDKDHRREWEKENRLFIGINLMRSTDADIIGYIDKKTAEGHTRQGVVKDALRKAIEEDSQR